jgi:PTH1 family peptidyl-tRNA hydrolase
MKLIVGLGNPGAEYARTRHNAGFLALEALAARLGAEFRQRKFQGQYTLAQLPDRWGGAAAGDGKLLLVKPRTYMNLSGECVRGFLGYYKLGLGELLVVVDDVALPLGALRLRRAGSAGGHKGLEDIVRRVGGTGYARLRLGVGGREAGGEPRVESLTGHVLGRFRPGEEQALAAAIERAGDACLTWAGEGCEAAMNRFNARPSGPEPEK